MELDNNIDEINSFTNNPMLCNIDFSNFDNKLENIIIAKLIKKINFNEYDLLLMSNEIISNISWCEVSDNMKIDLMEQFSIFINNINILYDKEQFAIFIESKINMLKDKYKKN